MLTPWLNKAPIHEYPSLHDDLEVDVCVIGGGITGIATAYLLLEQGKSVVLLERHRLAHGVSGHTSGHLTSLIDAHYYRLISDFSKEIAREIYEATSESRNLVERLLLENNFEAGYERVPAYYFASDEDQTEVLQKERQALEDLDVGTQDADVSVSFRGAGKAFKVEGQAIINAALFIQELAQLFVKKGGMLFEHSPVIAFKNKGNEVEVNTSGPSIKAKNLVQATHTPLMVNPIQMELKNSLSYVVVGETDMQVIKGLINDFADPYHYIRSYEEDGKRMMIIGGYDLRTGTEKDQHARLNELIDYASVHCGLKEVKYAWNSLFYSSPDGLPFIGKDPVHKNTYLATGFGGDGLTFGLVSAILISSLISKGGHSWEDLFTPTRFKLATMGSLVEKGMETARHLVLDRLFGWSETEELTPGEAKVLDLDGKKTGVYMDEKHEVHAVSAVCTHMKCILQWNAVAKTWDCGCHGSRFDIDGNIVAGPATEKLQKNEKGKTNTYWL